MTSRFVSIVSIGEPWLRLVGAAAFCGLLSLVSAPAEAQEALDLSWQAPADCPQREAVKQRTRELAGQALRNAERLRAEGRIERFDGRYRLTLIVRENGEARQRTMESRSCVDLAGAAAVALGLLLRQGPAAAPGATAPGSAGTESDARPNPSTPGVGERAPDSNDSASTRAATPVAPAEPAKPAKPADPEEPEEPASEEEDPTERPPDSRASNSSDAHRVRFALRAPLAVLDAGPLPKPSFGVGAGVGARYGEWRLVAVGRIFLDQTWLMPGSSDLGADVSRWQAELSVCRGWQAGRFELAPCLTLALDGISALGTGPGVEARAQRSIGFVPGVAGAAHFYVLESLAIFGSLGVGFETTRPVLVVEGLGAVGQVGPVQLSVALGPEWTF